MTVVHLVAGARPNFMKVAPLYHALSATDWAKPVLVHTGQHSTPNHLPAIDMDAKSVRS
jgi:UDP-N-acetylglucosamine 2-epimerase (non-hydrolysing)